MKDRMALMDMLDYYYKFCLSPTPQRKVRLANHYLQATRAGYGKAELDNAFQTVRELIAGRGEF